MPRVLICGQGHQWVPTAGPATCPICGGRAQTLVSSDSGCLTSEKTQILPPEISQDDTIQTETDLRVTANGPAATQQPRATQTDDETITLPPAHPAPDAAACHRVNLPGYEVLGELGRGGMGVVYKARQQGLNRLVALKMILSGVHAGPQEQARFRSEAEAVARLQHPNIVQIYAIGEQEGLPYFALELVDGGSLAQRLNGRPLPGRQAAELVETLARAMHVAHERGIVHRDLKPGNILLTCEGTPKITDFGLAKCLDGSGLGRGTTLSGTVMGTPSYMAPEQAGDKAKQIGPPTDVYALGAILYELLTGRPPFHAASPLDTVLQVLDHEPEQPRLYNPAIDASLEAICLKCLEKAPRDRYSSAKALADDLAAYLRGEPVQADGSTSRRLFRLLLRETRHTEVMALWGRVWLWHAVEIFFIFLATDGLIYFGVRQAWPYVALWTVGLISLLVPVWYYRFRSGIPMTPVERQLGQVWYLFAAGFILTCAIHYISNPDRELDVRSLLPVLVLECGLAFGCMSAILGGSFYSMTLACGALSLLLAFFPRVGALVFGVVFFVGLFVPGWRYSRAAEKKGK
jgi:predicted Ser/Thr protein kinase